MTSPVSIDRFSGVYRFLSNFYPSSVQLDGEMYSTVEHAYQAAKTLDPTRRTIIRRILTPSAAKRMGAAVPLRPDWEAVKLDIMRALLEQKFAEDRMLCTFLLATGEVLLIEGNTWWDTYWGRCQGVGENHLGLLLMEIRRARATAIVADFTRLGI